MIRALPFSAAVLITVLLNIAAMADDKPVSGDLAKFQGTWKGLAGKKKEIVTEYVIEGDSFKLRFKFIGGGDGGIDGKIKLDEAAKPHKTIDWTDQRPLRGGTPQDLLTIYAFDDDDTLRICNPPAWDSRPNEFFESKGGGSGTVVLKRQPRKSDPK